ncbi:hypothetical protein TOPH_07861 [Tolypocladium ophioglossoides CBS 100239]|uniref:54S ribosomal protein L11, mitochondrial n=1 Tax=Tolypocladium ophioglossoides (strain CBS 100239) TaxID=1163406 RepID=A0A0L0N0D0_TOLOC|nr:hypothetical protein TOPH_07861 [Tolypocladium ophioglossoides CBS 100239]
MVRRLARAARPCLRQLGRKHTTTPRTFWLIAGDQSFSTTSSGHAAAANASVSVAGGAQRPVDYTSPTKPPSARPVETRKSQLIRTYTSLLRTTPLILFFQHSNLTAVEWAAVRRELKKAVAAIPAPSPDAVAEPLDLAPMVQLQVLRTTMLDVALRIVEFYNPDAAEKLASTPRTARGPLVHDLSDAAYNAIRGANTSPNSAYAQIQPLMVGPLAALVLPAISPAHLAAALSVLSPVPGKFPAPTRKKNPGYHDATCQNGLAKLLLVGGRIEGKIFDQAGVNWVGSIEGGMNGLRAQLVGILQGAGLGIATTLEDGSRNLWLALEARRGQLEEVVAK